MEKYRGNDLNDPLRNRVVRIIRLGVLFWLQLGAILLILLMVSALFMQKIELYLDRLLFGGFYDFFVIPAAIANGINGFILMVEGRVKARWRWWQQLFALFGIFVPIYGIFYYIKCEQELRKSTLQSSI